MDTGSITFIVICTAMVCLMTPALAFFYGGLGRRKNVINTMMMSIIPMAIASLLWIVIGYSLSFGGNGNLFGNFSHVFLQNVSSLTSSRHLMIPDLLFSAFQMMFSIIAVGILTGSAVGRMRFKPLIIFITAWLLMVYYPFAHMVWDDGLLAQWGTIDFAGGNVVHITFGVSGLVLALVVGKRRDFHSLEHRPHNVPFVLFGAGLLWFGWFGFNAGSALAANGLAAHALMTTHISAAAAIFSCWASLIIGLAVSPVCYAAIWLVKSKLGWDDALDAFGCHGVGGIFGGLVTGVFTTPQLALNPDYIGLIYGNGKLFLVTIAAIIFTIMWSALVSFVIIKTIAIFMPLRVSDREEAIGMDDSEHNETAYPTFMGLDS